MKKAIKKRWLEALRSGEYKQGRNYLKATDKNGVDRFCCLGVLCDLYVKDHVTKHWEVDVLETDSEKDGSRRIVYGLNNNHVDLPDRVMKWAGLKDSNPDIVFLESELSPEKRKSLCFSYIDLNLDLATLNDSERRRFKFIAKIIEEQL